MISGWIHSLPDHQDAARVFFPTKTLNSSKLTFPSTNRTILMLVATETNVMDKDTDTAFQILSRMQEPAVKAPEFRPSGI